MNYPKENLQNTFEDFFGDLQEESGNTLKNVDYVSGIDMVLTDKQVFGALVADLGIDSKQRFISLLQFLDAMTQRSLFKQFSNARKNINLYWSVIEEYSNMSQEERSDVLGLSEDSKSSDVFSACQTVLFKSGSEVVSCGNNISELVFPLEVEETLGILTSKKKVFIESIQSMKMGAISNIFDRIILALPFEEASLFTSSADKYSKVFSMIDQFTNGYGSLKMKANTFKLPKEPGCLLPHTLSPTEWVTTAVSEFMSEQFGVVSLFNSTNERDMRRFSPDSNYVIYNSDEASPFSLITHPGLYMQECSDTEWIWRLNEKAVLSQVSAHRLQHPGISDTDLELVRLKLLRKMAADASPLALPITWKGVLGKVKPSHTNYFKRDLVVRFFSRGYSQESDVYENTDFIHIVRETVVSSINQATYIAISLPDLYSVMLIPETLWVYSKYMRSNIKSPLSSKYGVARFTNGLSGVARFMTLLNLSHTMSMLNAWKNNKPYKPSEFTDKLVESMSENPSTYEGLFSKGTKAPFMIGVTRMLSNMITSSSGLYLAPFATRVGKNSMNAFTENQGFQVWIEDAQFTDSSIENNDDENGYSFDYFDAYDNDIDSVNIELFLDSDLDTGSDVGFDKQNE